MKVLVTGASGTIGAAVCRELAGSVDVWSTSRTDLDRDQHLQGDLRREDDVRKVIGRVEPDVIIHLAGGTGSDQTELLESNVMTTVNILQSVEPSTRVIVAGSAAEYGSPDIPRADEDTPTAPVTAYGWSKVAQTRLARSIGDRRGVEVVVARPFNVVSPNMSTSTAIGNIADRIASHTGTDPLQLAVGRLDIVRDFVPLSFVAECFGAVAVADDVEDTYNICSGKGFTLKAVVDAMASLANVVVETSLDPRLAAIPAVDGIVGDPTRIAGLVGSGWKPSVSVLAAVALDRGPR